MYENLYNEKLIDELLVILKNDSKRVDVEKRAMFQNVYLEGFSEDGEFKNELMLRFIKPLNRIVIARVSFINQRAGHLTKVIETIEKYAPEYTELMFESVLTDELKSFCSKNGFMPEESLYETPSFVLNYIKKLNK